MRNFGLVLFIFMAALPAVAKRSPALLTKRSVASTDVARTKFFDLKDGQGRVFVIVHKNDQMPTHRYMVEVRPTCGSVTTRWRELPAVPVVAACHVDPSSIHYQESSNSIEFKIFRAGPDGRCRSDFETIRFPLSQLCDFE